jgi:hypothetical protein
MEEKDLKVRDLIIKLIELFRFLSSKWIIILIFSFLGAGLGFLKAISTNAKYEAKLTFVLEEEKSGLGGASSLANSLGIAGIGEGGEGDLFSSINFFDFLQSRNLIEKVLLDLYDEKTKKTFMQKYVEIYQLEKIWYESDKPELKRGIKFHFGDDRDKFSKVKDSILGATYLTFIDTHLKLQRPDTEKALMEITIITESEMFSKRFSEKLLEVAFEHYSINKIQKARNNVNILQRQADSVRVELYNALTGVAASNDKMFGLSPAMNVMRVPSAKKQVDVQVNTAILAELVKNLEISKMTLLNQTPLYQIVDKPILPLSIIKLGKIKALIIGGFLGGFLIISFFIFSRYIKRQLSNE